MTSVLKYAYVQYVTAMLPMIPTKYAMLVPGGESEVWSDVGVEARVALRLELVGVRVELSGRPYPSRGKHSGTTPSLLLIQCPTRH